MANKVFSINDLNQRIATFMETHDQDKIKPTSTRFNESIKALQRRLLFKLVPDEIFAAIGIERMRRVPIVNLYGTRICLDELRERDLPAPVVIGKQADILFIAYKIHYIVPGRLCSSLIVKESVGVIYSARWRTWIPAGDRAPLDDLSVNKESLGRLKSFLNGKSVTRFFVDEDKQTACWCECLFSLLRKCCFETDSVRYPYQMVLGT